MSRQSVLVEWLVKRGAIQIGSTVWTDTDPNDIDFILMQDDFKVMMKNVIKHKISHEFNNGYYNNNKLLNFESVKIKFGDALPVNVLSYDVEVNFNVVKTANELMCCLANKHEYCKLFRDKKYRIIFFEQFINLLDVNGVS